MRWTTIGTLNNTKSIHTGQLRYSITYQYPACQNHWQTYVQEMFNYHLNAEILRYKAFNIESFSKVSGLQLHTSATLYWGNDITHCLHMP